MGGRNGVEGLVCFRNEKIPDVDIFDAEKTLHWPRASARQAFVVKKNVYT